MNTNRFSKVIAATLLAGTPLFWSACTDTWDEHYSVIEGGMADQPTLLENIQADPSLTNFYRVIEAIGKADDLNSPQQLTVWAPKGMTSAQADSVIAVYQEDAAAGLKPEDNRAITQFYQNHVALYARTISSLTNDTIAMMNKKYMRLIGTSQTTGTLEGNPFDEAVVSSNGILYKTDYVQGFFPNIREYLNQAEGLDSIFSAISCFDDYILDPSSSVPGGVEDGQTVYLDSVTNLSNKLLNSLSAYIQREDSVYTVLAPSNELWQEQYEQYRHYFNYDPSVVNADSLSEANTRWSILRGRFFNTSGNIRYNRSLQDSIVNTQYRVEQEHNPRRNVYYGFQKVLNEMDSVQCSNGVVYIDKKGVIDPRSTFFGRSDLMATQTIAEVPTSDGEPTMNVNRNTHYQITRVDSTYSLKPYEYIMVTSKSNAHASIDYQLPSVYSGNAEGGAYYNVYVVTIPGPLPAWFQVGHTEKNARSTFPSVAYYTSPHPVQADGTLKGLEGSHVDNADVIVKQGSNATCFVAGTEKLDTILVQSAVQYPYSGYGLDDAVAKLSFRSFGPSSTNQREKIYTRTLRIYEIILVPFETKEDALKAVEDPDDPDGLKSINDDILEANKEN